MVMLFNTSLEIGSWLVASNNNITGSFYITVIFVLLLFLCLVGLFRIPFVFFLVIFLPLLIVFSLWDVSGQTTVLLSLAIFVIGFVLAKLLFPYR